MTFHAYDPDPRDPVLADAAVLSLVRRYVPQVRAVTGVDESGGEARAYFIDDSLVLKTQRPHKVRESVSMRKEAFLLRQLAIAGDFPVPRILGYGSDNGLEYTVMTRMPGDAILRANPAGEARRLAVMAAGRALRRIHAIPKRPMEQSGLFNKDRWFAHRTETFKEGLEQAMRALVKAKRWPLQDKPQDVAAYVLADAPDNWVVLHSNPGPQHCFVLKSGEFSGIIDFGDTYISHPALDLRPWREPSDRDAVLEGYMEQGGSVGRDFLAVARIVWAQAETTPGLAKPGSGKPELTAHRAQLDANRPLTGQ